MTYTNTFPQDEGKQFSPVENEAGVVMVREDGGRDYLYNNMEEVINSGRWAAKNE